MPAAPRTATLSASGPLGGNKISLGLATITRHTPRPARHRRPAPAPPRPGLPPEPVEARRVAEALAQRGEHGLQHAWVDGSRRVVIEVDAVHGAILPPRRPFIDRTPPLPERGKGECCSSPGLAIQSPP